VRDAEEFGPSNPAADQEETLKAIVYHRYGSPDVLELAEIDKPVVRDGEVLVRVCAAALNPADWHFMRGLPYIARVIFGLRKPRPTVLASDMAGHVEAVGKNVTGIGPGDEVFERTRTGQRKPLEPKGKLGAMTGYSWSTSR
jgi:NADPH:quinone reductase-like Zn-dependent oxidoreductase